MDRQVEISKGDVLISHRGQYHYLVEYIDGNKIGLFWLHRKAGEPSRLYTYRREVNIERAPSDYDVVAAKDAILGDYSNC